MRIKILVNFPVVETHNSYYLLLINKSACVVISGAAVAQHASKHLHKYIIRQSDYGEGKIVDAMQKGFLELDADMQADEVLAHSQSGSTVIALLIKNNVLYSVRIKFSFENSFS